MLDDRIIEKTIKYVFDDKPRTIMTIKRGIIVLKRQTFLTLETIGIKMKKGKVMLTSDALLRTGEWVEVKHILKLGIQDLAYTEKLLRHLLISSILGELEEKIDKGENIETIKKVADDLFKAMFLFKI